VFAIFSTTPRRLRKQPRPPPPPPLEEEAAWVWTKNTAPPDGNAAADPEPTGTNSQASPIRFENADNAPLLNVSAITAPAGTSRRRAVRPSERGRQSGAVRAAGAARRQADGEARGERDAADARAWRATRGPRHGGGGSPKATGEPKRTLATLGRVAGDNTASDEKRLKVKKAAHIRP